MAAEANNNPFSNQPTYSRDVCGLMRRINALESLASIPAGAFGGNTLLDFDVYDGRVYVLVWQREPNTTQGGAHRIKVHDATDGSPIYDFAVPAPVVSTASGISLQNVDALAPRLCVGDGSIFMVYSIRESQEGRYTAQPGGIVKFSLNGDGLESADWPEYDTTFNQSYGQTTISNDMRISKAAAFGEKKHIYGQVDTSQNDYIGQLHFVDGWVYGLVVRGYRPLRFSFSQTINYPPEDNSHEFSHVLFASSDLATLDWATSYREYIEDESAGHYWSKLWRMGMAPSVYSVGGCCPYGGNLYLDSGGEQPHAPFYGVTATPQFGRIPADGTAEVQQEFLHANFATFQDQIGSETWTQLGGVAYATDGVHLFATEKYLVTTGVRAYRLRRYVLTTGTYVEDLYLEDGNSAAPLAMRYSGGYLWLGYGGADYRNPGGQSRIDVRNPSDFSLVFSFYVGDPLPQTEWDALTESSVVSMGTPDGGVSVPELEALHTLGAIKNAQHIVQMRVALRRLAPFFLAPTGERLHLNGNEDGENLYALAMGDRSDYGATGGTIADFTRPDNLLWNPGYYEFAGAYYRVLKDHVTTPGTTPGVGGAWEEYWREASYEEVLLGGGLYGQWAQGILVTIGKTFDIDIGEIYECVNLLEGSSLASAPTGGTG